MSKRKKYSKEFKLDAVSLVLEQDYTRAEAAKSLGINANMLGRWIKEIESDDGQSFELSREWQVEPGTRTDPWTKKASQTAGTGERNLKKGDGILCSRNEVKYSFITQHKNTYPIRLMCQVIGVSRNGYYNYQSSSAREVSPEDQEMMDWIREFNKSSKNSYGSRRMKGALNVLGYSISRQKARRLMKKAGVMVRNRKKYKVTTNSNHKQPVFDNLVSRQFDVDKKDSVYAGDITYIWTQEGWLYLAVVLDLYSRRVVGWSMSSRMNSRLVCDALTMAIWNRQPAEGLICHSDRGSQYASKKYRKLLSKNGFLGSMSRKGDCWDNSVVESFFASLKRERVTWENYQSRFEAQQDILDYIVMFYNSTRLHSTLGYRSPNDYEQQKQLDLAA